MADPIPAADSALLAAQAKGGQAGVDAYNAAKADLQSQRQAAVQQAMQEAALRGAPQGAVSSIASTITGPYDQGIASLTQAGAAYQADMAARDQRMSDYEGAVNSARSFIPQMVEMTVGPIRAQNEFQLSQMRLQGQQSLDEIWANLDLTKAKMAAEAQAAELERKRKEEEAAAADMELNQGQLGGMIGAGVSDYLGGLSGKLEQDIHTQQYTKNLGARVASTLNPFAVGQQKAAQAKGDAEAKAVAARMSQDIAERSLGSFAAPRGGAAVAQGGTTGGKIMGPSDAVGAARLNERVAGALNPFYVGGQKAAASDVQRRTQERINQIAQDWGERNIVRSPVGIVSPQQLSGYSDEERGIIAGAPGKFNTPQDVQQMLMGQPYQSGTNPVTGQPAYATNPYAGQAAQFAAQIVAQRLADQGYQFNQADVYNALGYDQLIKPGMSAYDMQQALSGQPTSGQEINQAESDDRAAEAAAREQTRDAIAGLNAQDKATEEEARQAYYEKFGVDPPETVGTPTQVVAIVNQLGDLLDAAVGEAQKRLDDIRKQDSYTQSDEEQAIREAITAAGITGGDVAAYRILKDLLL